MCKSWDFNINVFLIVSFYVLHFARFTESVKSWRGNPKEQLKKEQIGKGSIQFSSLNVAVVVSGEVVQS